jgi:hypothetical protein
MMIEARAGTGKSATLRMMNRKFSDPTLYLVFDRLSSDKAKAEQKEGKWPFSTDIMTFNGCGHRTWMRGRNINLDKEKMKELLKQVLGTLNRDDFREASSAFFDITAAVDRAKNEGYVPDGKFYPVKSLISREAFHAKLEERPSPFIASIVDELLVKSIQAAFKGNIDFNDQIYMPTMFGSTFKRYPRILVDEFQDLNAVNIHMLMKMYRDGDWLTAVGDPAQSIYAFRGAVPGAMAKGAAHFRTKPFTLTESFRCPAAIVEAAKWRVPDYRTNKPGGRYATLSKLALNDIPSECTFICRNNAPLFAIAFRLLRNGRGVKVVGSDIGPRLIGVMKKFGDDPLSQEKVFVAIEAWLEKKMKVAQNPTLLADQAECMRVFATYGRTLGEAIAYIQQMFKEHGTIQLTTGHKAKGKEWNHVYFLDPWLISQDEQDLNLKYVIQTRALDTCLEIDSARIEIGE